uniref:RING-type domain-containing protein n=1 Tax=Chrysemys picta bellii TaxID=8478 RepID=A0A8C3FZW0_CHRPI
YGTSTRRPPAPMSIAGRETCDIICLLCQDYLTDPVTIECGHKFCLGCISQRCEGVETAACPQCGETFQKRAFRPDALLGSIIQAIKKRGLKPRQRGREGNVCGEHGKELAGFSLAQVSMHPRVSYHTELGGSPGQLHKHRWGPVRVATSAAHTAPVPPPRALCPHPRERAPAPVGSCPFGCPRHTTSPRRAWH